MTKKVHWIVPVHLLPIFVPPRDLSSRPATLRDAGELHRLLNINLLQLCPPSLEALMHNLWFARRHQDGELGKRRSDCFGLASRSNLGRSSLNDHNEDEY